MNAIRPVIQIPPPSDINLNVRGGTASAPSSDNKGFSTAMHSAGSRPARRITAHRSDDSSGNSLPPNGSLPPSTAPTAQRSAPPPAQAGTVSGQIDNSSTKSAPVQGSDSTAVSAANKQSATAPAATGEAATAAADAPAPAAAQGAAAAAIDLLASLGLVNDTPPAPTAAPPAVPLNIPAVPVAVSVVPAAAPTAAAVSNPDHGGAVATAAPQNPRAASSPAADVHIAVKGGAASGKALSAEPLPQSASDASSAANTAISADSPDPASIGSAAAAGAVTMLTATASAPPAAANAVSDASPPKAPDVVAAADKPLDQTADISAPQNTDIRPASSAAGAGIAQVIMGVVAEGAADRHSHSNDANASGAVDAAGAAQAGTSTPAAAPLAAPQFKVAAHVDSSEFGQGVATQVSVMVDNGVNTAKLQVNPASLGPIEVRIAIQGDHAQVSMMSHSAVTRDALESSSPKLREMLSAQGFGQVSVDISHRSFQERTPTAHSYEWNAGKDSQVTATPAASAGARSQNGLLDAYA